MLTCYVNGQCLTIKQPIVAADTIDYITAEFIFRTNEWDGLTKIAVFRQGEVTHTALLVDDKIEADAHVNLTEGDWEVGLIGESIDGEEIVRRITTELKTISVDRAAPNGGDPFPEYAGGVGEQIVAKAAEYMNSARDAESSASMHAMIANSAANFAANERYFAEEAKEQAVAAKDAAVDAKEYIEGIAIDIGIIGELITKDIGDWYHYDHTSDATYSANFLKTGSTIKSWPDATVMRSAISPVRTVGDDLYIFAFGYKWTRESMAMLPMEVFATVEQLYRRFLIDDKVVTYGVREAFTKDIYVVSFGYKQGKWFYTNTRMDGSKIEAYWDEGSLDFSSFVVRYSDAATPYADDVDLDDDTLKAIQSKLDISTKLSELDTDTEHRTVTDAEKAAWNAKSNFSGFYYDLIGKPSIPNKLASLEQDSTHRTVTDAEKAIWNSQSAPFTSNLLKGDGRGGMTEATPSRDYVDYNRDVSLSMVKSSYTLTSRTNFSVLAGDTTKIGGGTLLLKGYQKIETETPEIELTAPEIKIVSPSATLNEKDIATVDDIPTNLSDLSDDADHRTVTDAEKESWNNKGTYSKPVDGIPKEDLTSELQSSLDKADTAVQPETLDAYVPIEGNGFEMKHKGEIDIMSSYSYDDNDDSESYAEAYLDGVDDNPYLYLGVGRGDNNIYADVNIDYGFGDPHLSFEVSHDDVFHWLGVDSDGCYADGEKILTESDLDTKLAQCMHSYGVTLEGSEPNYRFVKDGATLTYNDLLDKCRDPQYFLYVEFHRHIFIPTMLPSVVETNLVFTCHGLNTLNGSLLTLTLTVYPSNQVKFETKYCAEKPTKETYYNQSELTLAIKDNHEYYIDSCSNITLTFPGSDFESHITFKFGSSFDVTFPSSTRYIGGEPQFAADSVWEVSIRNGIVVAGKVE